MTDRRDLKLNFLIQIIIAFLLTAFFTLVITNRMITGDVYYTTEPVQSVFVPPQAVPVQGANYQFAQIDLFQFLLSFFIATSLMLFFLKAFRGKFLFEFFFSGAIIFGAQGLFGIFFTKGIAFFASVLIVVIRFVYPRIWTQNFIIIIGMSGIAASLGTGVSPLLAIIILVLLSIYDVIAVYKTRHMVKLFQGMAKRGAVLAIVIPKKLSLWSRKFDLINSENKDEFIFIGTGDIILPLFFAASTFFLGVKFSIAIIFGAIIGFVVDHLIFIVQKEKKPIPALPAIALFSIASYLISLYLFNS